MSIKKSYRKSKRSYGSPRITEDLRDKGALCGKNQPHEPEPALNDKRRFFANAQNDKSEKGDHKGGCGWIEARFMGSVSTGAEVSTKWSGSPA